MNANTSRIKTRSPRRRWTDEQKLWFLQDQKKSGLSMWDYAQQKGVGYSSIAAWKRKFPSNSDKVDRRNGNAPVVFQELPSEHVSTSLPDGTPTLRVRFTNGTVIEVGAGCDPNLVQIILTHLR